MIDVNYNGKSFNVERDSRGNYIYSRSPVKVLLQCHACKEYTHNRKFGLCPKCDNNRIKKSDDMVCKTCHIKHSERNKFKRCFSKTGNHYFIWKT